MNILENESLIVQSKNLGAEITRIFSKKLNKEVLWNGNDKFWGRQSPILFPIVGKLKDNETNIENNLYSMNQHGFARDMNFVTHNSSNNSITYKLISNEDTKKLYPYSFELLITYTLVDSTVNIEWKVINTDEKKIYFSIGAHPAFNLNFENSNSISDYYIEFESKNKTKSISLEGPYTREFNSIDKLDKINLTSESFSNDALIYTNIDALSLKSKGSNEFINVSFKNFPLVGIWTPYYKDTNTTAPFLCIEPWYGVADSINSDKIFKNKNYINTLDINENFYTNYSISVG